MLIVVRAVEMARRFPQAKVVGFDLSQSKPSYVTVYYILVLVHNSLIHFKVMSRKTAGMCLAKDFVFIDHSN